MTPDQDRLITAALSTALDEIFVLRRALAWETGAIEQHLGFKTFPARRRQYAEQQIERMHLAARGHVQRAYAGTSSLSHAHGLREAGIDPIYLENQIREKLLPGVTDEDVLYDRMVSDAVSELCDLKRAAAYEAGVLRAHTGYSSFPKSRLKVITEQCDRLHAAAAGTGEAAYAGFNSRYLAAALEEAGAEPTLTRSAWEAEQRR